MGVPGNADLLLLKTAAGATGYQVSRSLRFSSGDSSYLSRTFGSVGNRTTWTWSAWVKRVNLGSIESFLFQGGDSDFNDSSIRFSSDKLTFSAYDGSANLIGNLQTAQVFRDTSAWYHIVAVYDSGNSTADDRMRLYVNGSQITTFSSRTNPNQNAIAHDFNDAALHNIGSYRTTSNYLSAYLAEIHFIDGSALTSSSFGETDATTGQWIPKTYTGSYGTNGFQLKFADNSNNTASTLGKDSAGSNNWTPNNLSVTAGAGNDSLVDTPVSYGTDTGAGGEVRGNYATLNALHGTGTLSNGNLDFTSGANPHKRAGTIGVATGKWYYEAVMTAQVGSYQGVGVGNQNYISAAGGIGGSADSWGILSESGINGCSYHNNSAGPDYGTINVNDVMMVAFDVDAGKIWFGVNGTWFNSGVPASGTGAIYTNLSGTLFPAISSGSGGTLICNFGQRAFAYTAPSGFKALCDTNLPAPVVAKPNTVFDVKLYTGNASTNAITGLGFSPDLVWAKSRSAATNHGLIDTVRGRAFVLISDSTVAEQNSPAGNDLASFDANGFTLGTNNAMTLNSSGQTYVAWAWDAGSSNTTNTAGSITSTVRVNATAGFSIVTYTTTGSASTIGHGLGVAPSLIITKQRNGTTAWYSYHASIGANNYLLLNSTAASAASSGIWNNTAPTSTVFTVGSGFGNGETYVAYAFSPVVGYSSAFSFTGTGSTDGPMVWLGFRPRFLIFKNASTAASWIIHDTARSSYNRADSALQPNSSAAEGSFDFIDILSNGFKLRSTDTSTNGNGHTIVGFAFAENPFQYARAR